MFILRNNQRFFISSIEKPHRFWYPINMEIPRYGDDYVRSKLGVTDPIQQRDLRIQFYEAIRNPKDCIKSMMLEQYLLDYGRFAIPFYLSNKTKDAITVFIEKGLNTLKPNPISGVWKHPHGNPWGIINKSDSPDEIALKLYDEDREFGVAMKETLDEILGW